MFHSDQLRIRNVKASKRCCCFCHSNQLGIRSVEASKCARNSGAMKNANVLSIALLVDEVVVFVVIQNSLKTAVLDVLLPGMHNKEETTRIGAAEGSGAANSCQESWMSVNNQTNNQISSFKVLLSPKPAIQIQYHKGQRSRLTETVQLGCFSCPAVKWVVAHGKQPAASGARHSHTNLPFLLQTVCVVVSLSPERQQSAVAMLSEQQSD